MLSLFVIIFNKKNPERMKTEREKGKITLYTTISIFSQNCLGLPFCNFYTRLLFRSCGGGGGARPTFQELKMQYY